ATRCVRVRQHFVQRARGADRLYSRGGIPLLHADGDGLPGARGFSAGETRAVETERGRLVEARIRSRLMHWAAHDLPRPDRAGLRHFGLVTGLTVIGLFGLALPWLLKRPHPQWPWGLGGLLVALALVMPNALRVVHG